MFASGGDPVQLLCDLLFRVNVHTRIRMGNWVLDCDEVTLPCIEIPRAFALPEDFLCHHLPG